MTRAATASELVADARTAAELERRQWPLKIVGAGVPTFLIPIRAVWAAQLFESRLAEATLFGRETQLGLSREHVYYRSPANAHGIQPPARILWYVSGSGPAQHESHVRALSQLVEVVVDDWRTLYRRFARLGIYEARQVRETADGHGQVMALRFVSTELLHEPIGLRALRALFADAHEPFHPPQSPSSLSEHMFCLIYEKGSLYGR